MSSPLTRKLCQVRVKAQHAQDYLPVRLLLLELREAADLTQRDLGKRLKKPQSWIHNCETGNRRVDLAEFVSWTKACDIDPIQALKRFLRGAG